MSRHESSEHDGPEDEHPYSDSQGVAIIGMACRFADAESPARFWSNLVDGVESITVEDGAAPDGRLRAASTLDGIDEFDAGFFGYNPREAALLDPQHRLFLEVCWEALEDGGSAGRRRTTDIGVYGGSGTSLYLMHNLIGQAGRPLPNFLDSTDDLQLAMAADRDYLTSRVAYKLGLSGPSVTVQAACGTSLYALHLACQALLAGECDLALAGGAHVPVPQIDGYQPEPGLVMSQDGHCRAFDARATGTVFGSGVGVVLLKPLAQALADGDSMYAVVRGTAVNNDGSGKPGFSTPSVAGQAAVIRQALAAANVEAGSISYVEAHGTATPTGDPIEIAALTEAFQGVRPQSCALGSVKTNIGHLSWAGGVSGLIKVALSLRHRKLPASLHFREPNPAIDFAASPFYVQSETTGWDVHGGPRRAGVSAFGLGGTNAHAILEEPPDAPAGRNVPARAVAPGPQVLPISGHSESALRDLAARVSRALLDDDAAPEVIDAAYTLGTGRQHFAHRAAVVGSDHKTLAALLDAVADGQDDVSDRFDGEIGLASGRAADPPPRLTTLFSGQGGEYLEACRDLYLSEPVFQEFVDSTDPYFRQHTGYRLSEFLYQDGARRGMPIADIRLAQPIVYALQVGLMRLWRGWGITPDTYIGHSLGEYAAAHCAGVFDFETGLYLVCERGKLLDTLPDSGAMAAVFAGEPDVLDLLEGNDQVDIAAVNAPNRIVISGDRSALHDVVTEAEKRGITCRKLRISRAGHSRQMDAIQDGYSAVLESVEMRPPTHTIISTLTGSVIGDEIATAGYWRRQLRHPVRFFEALRGAASDVFLEIGLSNTLANLAQVALGDGGEGEPTFLETLRWERDDIASTRLALAGAYSAGMAVDWAAVSPGGRMVTLPTYPFQRSRHWISPTGPTGVAAAGRVASDAMGAVDAPVTDHPHADGTGHYVVTWADAPPVASAPVAEPLAGRRCLVVEPSTKSGADLARELERLGAEVLVHALSDEHDDAVAAAARAIAEYRPATVVNAVPALRKRHADLGGLPLTTESVSGDVVAAGGLATLRTFQAVSAANPHDVTVCTVTSGAHQVLTSDDVIPAQGAVIGVARTARTELSTVHHMLIDLDPADTRQRWSAAVARLAAAIGSAPAGDAELALRGDRTLLPCLRPAMPPSGGGRVRIDPGGWYILTGGLSGIGLECARALLELGARRLVVSGRRAPRRELAERMRRLRQEFAADIRTETVDVTSRPQVARLLADYSSGDFAVRGIIHAAGVIDDGIIDRTDWSRMARVLAPKAQGAWNLHRCATEYAPDLDLFVMTSSYGGLFGNPGQAGHAAANTFLDALAGHRRAVGLPGLSLDLGSWSDVGYLAGNDGYLRRLEEQGVGTISSSEGRPVVRAAIEGWPAGQVAILPTRWHDLDPDHHLASNPVLNGVTGDGSAFSPGDADAPAPVTPADIMACCQGVVARVLGYDVEELGRIDLAEAGMDSLNALTIRNRLQRLLSVPLPASICFDRPTLSELAADIEKRMTEIRS
ncbi:type I polyketide synthase [Actinomadura soli]|uniref:Type I polyketide synthase n=1 Tax=Actinomadura soli TaxID=2508997 RepID=A0A5C4JIL2_9ACTN|nr:type I polyketide synthase [Actinomadura soli]TMR06542.1 type I polyketide synthase [Actinomadura soli]